MTSITKILISIAVVLSIVAVFLLFTSDINLRESLSVNDKVQKVYFADHISPAHQAVIDKFNKKYKGRIEVISVDLPFSKFTTNERKELLARSLRSKSDRLDVFSVDYIWTSRFAKWCETLDQYFNDDARSKIISPTIQSCFANGKLVAMPLYIDIGMMYYRKDIIQKLPNAVEVEKKLKESITWDELLSYRGKLGYAHRPYYIFQANDYEGLICNYFEIIKSLDKNFFANNVINLKKPAAKKALQFLVDFVHKQKISPPEVIEFDENKSYDYLLQNDAVFVRGWPNFLENYQKMYPEGQKYSRIERAALPHFTGNAPTSVYGGWNLMVSKFSTKKESAVEFIRYLQTEEAQKTMFEMGGYIPVNQEVYLDTMYLTHHPDLVYYRRLVASGFHRPSLEEYTKISDIIAHYVHLAIKGEVTVDEAIDRASQAMQSKSVLLK
ncbi:MAG: extracellular solute-binding protein [Bacteroidota bacterium]|nr:extracellular solute-binding protein [Bacteroidota bacterium]